MGILLIVPPYIGSSPVSSEPSPSETFEEVYQLCLDHFYNPAAVPDWGELRREFLPIVEKSQSLEETSTFINQMLSRLKASHTHFYTRFDLEYYDLLDMFKGGMLQQVSRFFPGGMVTYASIGTFTKKREGKTFVKAVLDGGPASRTGILTGDEILSVDGQEYHPIKSFSGKAEKKVRVRLQRSANQSPEMDIEVIPDERSPNDRYLEAMRESAKVIQKGDCSIAYIHAWSFAGEQ